MTRCLLLLFLILTLSASAQKEAELYKKIFPDENMIYTNIEREYIFDVNKSGQLEMVCNYHHEQMYLSDKARSNSDYTLYESSFMRNSNIEAYTQYNGKKYPVKDFKSRRSVSRNIFFDDNQALDFEFIQPNEGAVSVLNYTTTFSNPFIHPEVYFDNSYPVAAIKITFKVDKDIDINFIEKNFTPQIKKSNESSKRYNTYVYSATNLPKINYKNFESNAVNRDYYVPHIIYHIKSYRYNDAKKQVLNDLADMYKWNLSNAKEAAFLHKEKNVPADIQKTIDSFKAIDSKPLALMKNIYNYVQTKVAYVAIEDSLAGFVPRQPDLVYHRKYGDCKDMACLLNYMLRLAGIESYPTWIGTRDIPYKLNEVPLPTSFNHMITTAKVNDNYYFLDPTMRFLPYQLPSFAVQKKDALLLLNENEFKVLEVPGISADLNVAYDSTIIRIDQSDVNGSVYIQNSGYPAVLSRYAVQAATKSKFDEQMFGQFKRGSDKCFVREVKEQNSTTLDLPHLLSADIKISNYANKIDNKYIVNLNLEKIYNNYFLDEKNRDAAEEFNFEQLYTNVVVLKIPDAYKVTYLPEAFSLSNDLMDCNIVYKNTGQAIELKQTFKVKKLMIEPALFKVWNAAIRQISAQYKENVILSPL